MRLNDGESGYSAKVDNYGRVAGYTVNVHEGNFIALKEENGFSATTDFLTLNSINTNHPILWMRNVNQNLKMFFSCFIISWNGGNTTGNEKLKLKIYRNPTIPTENSGTYTIIDSYNINFGTFQSSDDLIYSWNGTGDGMEIDLTNCDCICNNILTPGSNIFLEANSVILDNKNSILFSVESKEIGELSIVNKFYFNDKHI